jgi:hypothetical protein
MNPMSENRSKPRGRPWPKGTSGNEGGRPKSQLNSLLAAHLAGKDKGDTRTREQHLVEAIVNLAMGGDLDAITFIWDRLEGKPVQTIEASGAALPVVFIPSFGDAGDQ